MKNPTLEAIRKKIKPIDRLKFLHSFFIQNSEYFREAYEKKLKQKDRPEGWDWNASALTAKHKTWRNAARELKEVIELIEKEL